MTRAILTTVGTSLLANAAAAKAEPAEFLRRDPKAACAESNVLCRIAGADDKVILFYSATPAGEKCAAAIELWLTGRVRSVRKEKIAGLTYHAGDFDRGMRSLVRVLSESLRQALRDGDEPVLNALGGFKAEVAYATLVGALFRVGNYYIHQGFDDLQKVPPLPVSWDFAAIDPHADTLRWLDDEPRRASDADARLKQMPPDVRAALTDEPDGAGMVYLSALGYAYFEAYLARIEAAPGNVFLSETALKTYSSLDPTSRAAFDAVFARLNAPEIRNAGSETMKAKKGDATKVFPQGHVNERVLWYEDESERQVRVLNLVRHGPKYDELWKRGVRHADYGVLWTAWQRPP